jgi:hypothetical protein
MFISTTRQGQLGVHAAGPRSMFMLHVYAAYMHRWAPMAKKNIDWFDTDNQLAVKNIGKIDKRKIFSQWIDTIGGKSIFFTDDLYYRLNF